MGRHASICYAYGAETDGGSGAPSPSEQALTQTLRPMQKCGGGATPSKRYSPASPATHACNGSSAGRPAGLDPASRPRSQQAISDGRRGRLQTVVFPPWRWRPRRATRDLSLWALPGPHTACCMQLPAGRRARRRRSCSIARLLVHGLHAYSMLQCTHSAGHPAAVSWWYMYT
jgi:hypothetical protein